MINKLLLIPLLFSTQFNSVLNNNKHFTIQLNNDFDINNDLTIDFENEKIKIDAEKMFLNIELNPDNYFCDSNYTVNVVPNSMRLIAKQHIWKNIDVPFLPDLSDNTKYYYQDNSILELPFFNGYNLSVSVTFRLEGEYAFIKDCSKIYQIDDQEIHTEHLFQFTPNNIPDVNEKIKHTNLGTNLGIFFGIIGGGSLIAGSAWYINDRKMKSKDINKKDDN